jgi:hypothetical protein
MQPEALDILRWQDDGGASALDNRTCLITTERTWLITQELMAEWRDPLAIAQGFGEASTTLRQ